MVAKQDKETREQSPQAATMDQVKQMVRDRFIEDFTTLLDRAIDETLSLSARALFEQFAATMRTVPLTKSKSPLRHRSSEEMQCRYEDSRGRRCDSRSLGPRWRYRCMQHLEPDQAKTMKKLQRAGG